jgi:hypothetical protein
VAEVIGPIEITFGAGATIPAGTGPKWTVSINTTTDQTKVFRAVPITAS